LHGFFPFILKALDAPRGTMPPWRSDAAAAAPVAIEAM
jgi:hypothetical protein